MPNEQTVLYAKNVLHMLDMQQRYFASKDPQILSECKRIEKTVREASQHIVDIAEGKKLL